MSIISNNNLNYNERPDDVESYIQVAFNNIRDQRRTWGYNGQNSYNFFDVDEHELFAKMIQNAPKKRRNFYFLDIGAGNFSSVNACAKFMNQQTNLREGIKIHIIGIRGEYNGYEHSEEEVGCCKLYKLGAFKIEHLFKEFQERGLLIEGKLDVVMSGWTLCHCVDPVALLKQTHDLLRVETGLFFFDTFHFKYKDESFFSRVDIPPSDDFSDHLSSTGSRARIIQLLLDMKTPFLIAPRNDPRGHDSFVLQRKAQNLATLQMRYSTICEVWDARAKEIAASGSFIEFERTPQEEDVNGFNFPLGVDHFTRQFFGDKALYTCLRTYQLFRTIYRLPVWAPIRKQEEVQDENSLYMRQCVIQNDLSEVQEWMRDVDINQGNHLGRTPLHLAVIHQKKEIFSFLLEKGASVHLSSNEGKTPLAYAAEIDQEGTFIEALLTAGASVDGKDDWEGAISPLSCAIEAKNKAAIILLLKAGAIPSQQNLVTLESKEFLELHQKRLIPLQTPGGNFMQDIVHWIRNGYYVVLHENGARLHGYFEEAKQGPIKKLIVVDFHPKENLLDPTELPELIRIKPRLTSLAAFDQLDQAQFDSHHALSLGY